MPMSQAAIDGISAHGLGWKREIKLGALPEAVGQIRDGNEMFTPERCTAIYRRIHDSIKTFANSAPLDIRRALSACNISVLIEDGVDIEDVVPVLSDVYDVFDYYRILVL